MLCVYELANDFYVQHSVAESELVDILRMSGSQKQVCQLHCIVYVCKIYTQLRQVLGTLRKDKLVKRSVSSKLDYLRAKTYTRLAIHEGIPSP